MGSIWYEVVNGEGRQVAVCQSLDDAECLAKRYSGGEVREGRFVVMTPLATLPFTYTPCWPVPPTYTITIPGGN